jgi:hypothetical protein
MRVLARFFDAHASFEEIAEHLVKSVSISEWAATDECECALIELIAAALHAAEERGRAACHGAPEGAPSGLSQPNASPATAKPRLIASQPVPLGNVVEIMADIMAPGRGKVELADVFAAFAAACEQNGKRPVPASDFPEALFALCAQLNIQIEATDKGVFLLKIKIRKIGKEGIAS